MGAYVYVGDCFLLFFSFGLALCPADNPPVKPPLLFFHSNLTNSTQQERTAVVTTCLLCYN